MTGFGVHRHHELGTTPPGVIPPPNPRKHRAIPYLFLQEDVEGHDGEEAEIRRHAGLRRVLPRWIRIRDDPKGLPSPH